MQCVPFSPQGLGPSGSRCTWPRASCARPRCYAMLTGPSTSSPWQPVTRAWCPAAPRPSSAFRCVAPPRPADHGWHGCTWPCQAHRVVPPDVPTLWPQLSAPFFLQPQQLICCAGVSRGALEPQPGSGHQCQGAAPLPSRQSGLPHAGPVQPSRPSQGGSAPGRPRVSPTCPADPQHCIPMNPCPSVLPITPCTQSLASARAGFVTWCAAAMTSTLVPGTPAMRLLHHPGAKQPHAASRPRCSPPVCSPSLPLPPPCRCCRPPERCHGQTPRC